MYCPLRLRPAAAGNLKALAVAFAQEQVNTHLLFPVPPSFHRSQSSPHSQISRTERNHLPVRGFFRAWRASKLLSSELPGYRTANDILTHAGLTSARVTICHAAPDSTLFSTVFHLFPLTILALLLSSHHRFSFLQTLSSIPIKALSQNQACTSCFSFLKQDDRFSSNTICRQ